jgi:hypothetical protein
MIKMSETSEHFDWIAWYMYWAMFWAQFFKIEKLSDYLGKMYDYY